MTEYNAYLTYEEYKELGGIVSESAFAMLERKSHRLIDAWTQERIKHMDSVPEEVKETMTYMINRLGTAEEEGGERLTSFSNGKVSMSFDTSKTIEQEMCDNVMMTLPKYLIYRGAVGH